MDAMEGGDGDEGDERRGRRSVGEASGHEAVVGLARAILRTARPSLG
jgi:hypothetical protein